MDNMSAAERQRVEIELLQAMYPDQIKFSPQSCELKYTGTAGGVMLLRIPESYPERELPDLISATDATKCDMRAKTKTALDDMKLLEGEELLDAVIQAFDEVTSMVIRTNEAYSGAQQQNEVYPAARMWKTVIVWLHHLLNTNKRKLALDPTLHAAPDGGIVSGVTKPGYPGVLVYSGPVDLVNAHVTELRQQKWQAFQVRYEEEHSQDKEWVFGHSPGIKEVESISDVVQSITAEDNREAFLKAVGVK